jgi:CRISPR-associated protein Csb2
MPRGLLISVRFCDGRYHGNDWPPAPARLFQALLAAAARGAMLSECDRAALAWLERLPPPTIAAPLVRAGQGFRSYVPNNDLDAVDGDISRIGEIRASKAVKPLLFDENEPLLYAWAFEADPQAMERAQVVARVATQLYQLGRGIDLAWASAETIDEEAADRRLSEHGGSIHRPGNGQNGQMLLCPGPGSLKSLEERFRASRSRFAEIGKGKRRRLLFSQPPRARLRSVSYNCPPVHLLFEIRETGGRKADPDFAPWPLKEAAAVTIRIRDGMARRLSLAFKQKQQLIERLVIGRDASEADKRQRLRIIPLPSTGHAYVDHAIRRVLVEVPPDCPFAVADIEWAVSGLELGIDQDTGEVLQFHGPALTPAQDRTVLRHYGIGRPARVWRTVTPVALPQEAARRRIEPSRLRDDRERKDAKERLQEEKKASGAVRQALRHAGIDTEVATIHVQREPFSAKGARSEAFAASTRFAKERLWHVEIAFTEAVGGPVVLGDGRFQGLGLLQRSRETPADVIAFSLPATARISVAGRGDFIRAVRRALMALSRRGDGTVPALFSGHEADGAAASSGHHRHVFLAAADLDGDGRIERLIVAAPWAGDRSIQRDASDASLFERVVSGLEVLRAGRLGVIPLTISAAEHALMGPAQDWESHTDYRPARHAGRGKDPAPVLSRDVAAECERRGLPIPQVELLHLAKGPKGGIAARLRLRFAVAVSGPILLGRDSHKGGGMFCVSH